jgi:2-polyprenyl-3-methyl-5-hydroxy-6-metoxy-1,4-benzoquinol methylase
LIEYLCDPVDGSNLELRAAKYDSRGHVHEGLLVSKGGRSYPVRNGVPRFVESAQQGTVHSFGDEWNYFNFDRFSHNWREHTVRNTFGSTDVFKNKIVVDAGAGSGMQSRWMAEAGARHVISLELSHSVDGIMQQNLRDLPNVDIVQCSIDQPPIRAGAVGGIVICHNVIQHTPSVERTAQALWRLVAHDGEFAFNCYMLRPEKRLWMLRYHLYQRLRRFLSKRSFRFVHAYAKAMAVLRFVPLLGWLLERTLLMIRGDVPKGPHYLGRCYHASVLNTFDWYGSHTYQHHKTERELRDLVLLLQPDALKVKNLEPYFSFPPPIGCAIRLQK